MSTCEFFQTPYTQQMRQTRLFQLHKCHLSQCENVSLASPQGKLWVNQPSQPTLAQCSLTQRAEELLTCPQSSSPTPTNRHHSHCSMLRGAQLKGFPPHCTITICGRHTRRHVIIVTHANTVLREKHARHHLALLHHPVSKKLKSQHLFL